MLTYVAAYVANPKLPLRWGNLELNLRPKASITILALNYLPNLLALKVRVYLPSGILRHHYLTHACKHTYPYQLVMLLAINGLRSWYPVPPGNVS